MTAAFIIGVVFGAIAGILVGISLGVEMKDSKHIVEKACKDTIRDRISELQEEFEKL